MRKALLWVLAIALVPGCVFAVDGVVLINQSTVMAAGGFPYLINQPGSYKLAGNLVVPAGKNGIQISVPRVTLDLNGFSITTPDPAATPPFFLGIQYTSAVTPTSIVIRGGTVDGFEVPIQLISTTGINCQYCTFTDLITRVPLGGSSWDLGIWTRVENVTAVNSEINVICPSVVVNTVISTISQHFFAPGDPNPPSQGACTFVNNATAF